MPPRKERLAKRNGKRMPADSEASDGNTPHVQLCRGALHRPGVMSRELLQARRPDRHSTHRRLRKRGRQHEAKHRHRVHPAHQLSEAPGVARRVVHYDHRLLRSSPLLQARARRKRHGVERNERPLERRVVVAFLRRHRFPLPLWITVPLPLWQTTGESIHHRLQSLRLVDAHAHLLQVRPHLVRLLRRQHALLVVDECSAAHHPAV